MNIIWYDQKLQNAPLLQVSSLCKLSFMQCIQNVDFKTFSPSSRQDWTCKTLQLKAYNIMMVSSVKLAFLRCIVEYHLHSVLLSVQGKQKRAEDQTLGYTTKQSFRWRSMCSPKFIVLYSNKIIKSFLLLWNTTDWPVSQALSVCQHPSIILDFEI